MCETAKLQNKVVVAGSFLKDATLMPFIKIFVIVLLKTLLLKTIDQTLLKFLNLLYSVVMVSLRASLYQLLKKLAPSASLESSNN